jgi:hypothetical protein
MVAAESVAWSISQPDQPSPVLVVTLDGTVTDVGTVMVELVLTDVVAVVLVLLLDDEDVPAVPAVVPRLVLAWLAASACPAKMRVAVNEPFTDALPLVGDTGVMVPQTWLLVTEESSTVWSTTGFWTPAPVETAKYDTVPAPVAVVVVPLVAGAGPYVPVSTLPDVGVSASDTSS